jgi:hypothetical protein
MLPLPPGFLLQVRHYQQPFVGIVASVDNELPFIKVCQKADWEAHKNACTTRGKEKARSPNDQQIDFLPGLQHLDHTLVILVVDAIPLGVSS